MSNPKDPDSSGHYEVYPPAMVTTRHAIIAICLTLTCSEVPPAQTAPVAQQKPATRRSQRVQMPALDVRSPDGQVTFKFLPNAERAHVYRHARKHHGDRTVADRPDPRRL